MVTKKQDVLVRLQKVIADCGITSRRKAEDLITQGRVTVNGDIVTELGTKVNPSEDVIVVDGQTVDLNFVQRVYIVFNKPRGCVTTLSDPEGRQTVMDYLKEVPERIYPVGRLDYLSEGLLILTNDGDVANMIMHPRYEITKVYEVKVFGAITDTILKKLRDGVDIEGEFVKPIGVRIIEQLPNKTWLEFRLGEGKNREIRRICEGCGVTVDKLKRVAIEGLSLGDLPQAKFYYLTKAELLNALGMHPDGTKMTNRVYQSNKKTVDIKRKGPQEGATPADDKGFYKFRREYYFQTVKTLNERKAERQPQSTTVIKKKSFSKKKP